MNKIDVSKLTPMMKQYMQIKENNKDAILFYRLGDFYEMFFDDALTASRVLEIALTSRDCGGGQKAPMCGVPHHVSKPYLIKLVENGYKVAIVEQVEDPKTAKGLVKRNVTKIVTPGTLTDLEGKDSDNNFLMAIFSSNSSFGVSYIDVTTGEFKTTELINIDSYREILDLIVKVNPKEVLFNKPIKSKTISDYLERKSIFSSYFESSQLDLKSNLKKLEDYIGSKGIDKALKNKSLSILSANLLLDYIYLYQDKKLNHIDNLVYFESKQYLKLDASTRDNLEIHKNLNDSGKRLSLLWVLDKTLTPMGARKLNSWLEFPLIDLKKIEYRQNIIEYFYNNNDSLKELKEYLSSIFDLERILSKISYSNANARDLLNLASSLKSLPYIKATLLKSKSDELAKMGQMLDDLQDIYSLIDNAILEDAPLQITEGGIIKEGYSVELDNLKSNSKIGKEKLIEYEKQLKNETGIKSLKISYNKNVGYFIELTKSFIKDAPEFFIRRQTLKNSERYVTQELNDISDLILDSQNDTRELEYKIFSQIRDNINENSARIKTSSDLIASIDAFISLASVALDNKYVRPDFNDKGIIDIKEGRHPVIEKNLAKNQFISNDTFIGEPKDRIQIITGPNMAGKSTYMRQMALIIIMGHIGSFVPAKKANLTLHDALFTRIGASDNLAKGDSTFMVEMKEMSNILNSSTKDSFIILDEVGRGTSTNDGLSIARSIVEYISKKIKAITFFATHYHELTNLADQLNNVNNLKVDILEEGGDLVFLRKILPGSASRSYGIEVAKLSGLPDEVIQRANKLLESADQAYDVSHKNENKQIAMDFSNIDYELFIKEVSNLDIDEMSPKESLDYLYKLKNRAKDIIDD